MMSNALELMSIIPTAGVLRTWFGAYTRTKRNEEARNCCHDDRADCERQRPAPKATELAQIALHISNLTTTTPPNIPTTHHHHGRVALCPSLHPKIRSTTGSRLQSHRRFE